MMRAGLVVAPGVSKRGEIKKRSTYSTRDTSWVSGPLWTLDDNPVAIGTIALRFSLLAGKHVENHRRNFQVSPGYSYNTFYDDSPPIIFYNPSAQSPVRDTSSSMR